jgi:hypothetical protein
MYQGNLFENGGLGFTVRAPTDSLRSLLTSGYVPREWAK